MQSTSMNGKKKRFFSSRTLSLTPLCGCVFVVYVSLFFCRRTQATYYIERMIQQKKKEEKEEKSMQRGRNSRDRNRFYLCMYRKE